jgi:hypothetical protein
MILEIGSWKFLKEGLGMRDLGFGKYIEEIWKG